MRDAPVATDFNRGQSGQHRRGFGCSPMNGLNQEAKLSVTMQTPGRSDSCDLSLNERAFWDDQLMVCREHRLGD